MPFQIAIVGLDTSHGTAFPEIMQDPASAFSLPELHAVKCFAFETAFQDAEGIARRAAYLQRIGVKMTATFEEAVEGCDAVFLELNDPALHLPYFRKAAALGIPVFLDKPFADTVANAREILRISRECGTRFFTASSLRFAHDFAAALNELKFVPCRGTFWGPLGHAASGSSVVWYGVHTVEMLQRALGRGASSVRAVSDEAGCTAVVSYPDGRHGVIELIRGFWKYEAVLRGKCGEEKMIGVTEKIPFYYSLLQQILNFLQTGKLPVEHEDSLEVMAILEAIDESCRTGAPAAVQTL